MHNVKGCPERNLRGRPPPEPPEQRANLGLLPIPDAKSAREGSPAQQRRAPSEATPHCLEQNEVAALYAPVGDRIRQRQRD